MRLCVSACTPPSLKLCLSVCACVRAHVCETHGWMDGWMHGRMDGWLAGWIDGWLDGWTDGGIYGCTSPHWLCMYVRMSACAHVSVTLCVCVIRPKRLKLERVESLFGDPVFVGLLLSRARRLTTSSPGPACGTPEHRMKSSPLSHCLQGAGSTESPGHLREHESSQQLRLQG